MSIISKLLMYLFVLALIVAIGLWVMGGQKTQNEGSIEIKATPQQVFEVLSQPEQRQKWLLNATSVEQKSKLPLSTKTEYITKHAVEGKTFETTDSIQQITEPEWLSIRMESASSSLVTMFEINRSGDQTRLNYKASEMPTPLYRLMAPFRKVELQPRIDEELVRIKRLSEQAAANSESTAAEQPEPPATEAAPTAPGDQKKEGE